ncbi:MAG TPA: 4-aminobutyrate--2-oxoglutarate transaminase [Myxococcales bacterium]|nr:4-aminobutyrate--2-oxoglutarate transaminase [Myxococcales bacterium]
MATIQLKTQVPGPRSLALWERRQAVIARGLATLHPVFLERGEGAAVTDVDGNRLLDFTGGIGALNVGHARPEIAKAIEGQAARLTHTAIQVTGYEPYVALAEKLCAIAPIAGPKKAFLVTTGTEAVENAVKLARAASGRSGVLCFEHAFHGRSLGALSFTSRARPYKFGMGPFLPEVYRLPYPTFYRQGLTPQAATDAFRARLAEFFRTVAAPEQIAALIIEPVLGEGGFLVPPPGFLEHLREQTRQHGIALIVDEVQSGFCRSGRMFAIESFDGVQPDLICMAKSLAGGLPLAAVVGKAAIMDSAEPGALGGTYAGNPIACAAAIEALQIMEREKLAEKAQRLGEHLRRRLEQLQQREPLVGDVRGLGAMMAVELVTDRATRAPATDATARTVQLARSRGLLMLPTGTYGNVLRFLVPLTIAPDQVDEALDVLERALRDAHSAAVSS